MQLTDGCLQCARRCHYAQTAHQSRQRNWSLYSSLSTIEPYSSGGMGGTVAWMMSSHSGEVSRCGGAAAPAGRSTLVAMCSPDWATHRCELITSFTRSQRGAAKANCLQRIVPEALMACAAGGCARSEAAQKRTDEWHTTTVACQLDNGLVHKSKSDLQASRSSMHLLRTLCLSNAEASACKPQFAALSGHARLFLQSCVKPWLSVTCCLSLQEANNRTCDSVQVCAPSATAEQHLACRCRICTILCSATSCVYVTSACCIHHVDCLQVPRLRPPAGPPPWADDRAVGPAIEVKSDQDGAAAHAAVLETGLTAESGASAAAPTMLCTR